MYVHFRGGRGERGKEDARPSIPEVGYVGCFRPTTIGYGRYWWVTLSGHGQRFRPNVAPEIIRGFDHECAICFCITVEYGAVDYGEYWWARVAGTRSLISPIPRLWELLYLTCRPWICHSISRWLPFYWTGSTVCESLHSKLNSLWWFDSSQIQDVNALYG